MSKEFDDKIKKLKKEYEGEDPSAIEKIKGFEQGMIELIKKSSYAELEITQSIRKEIITKVISISKTLSLVRILKDETRDTLFGQRAAYMEVLKLFPEGDFKGDMLAIEKIIDFELEEL